LPRARHLTLLAVAGLLALAAAAPKLGWTRSSSETLRSNGGPKRELLSSVSCRGVPSFVSDGGWALHVLAILYLFLGIAIVCDDFFTPSLEIICEKLGLSEDVAGATFMAAGSSAPELFTSTMSLVSDNATNELGVATIVGSAVFNILIIVAATVIFSGESHLALDWRPVTRDCAFYAVSIAFVMGVMWDGRVYWWEGVVSVCLYFSYVGFMTKNEHAMAWMERAARGFRRRTLGNKIASFVGETDTDTVLQKSDIGAARSVVELSWSPEEGVAKGCEDETADDSSSDEEAATNPFAIPDDWRGWPMWLLSLPWYAAFTLTVPDCGKSGWERWYLVSFFSSVLWISAISYGMVDAAAVVGCVLDVPEVVMGTLVLAAGTSIPDALSSVSVAKAGQGDMAVANAVGSNVFDIWLGLGLPWLVFLPARGGFEEVSTAQLWPSVCILAGVLLVYYASLVCTGFRLNRSMGYVYLFVYGLFVAYSVVGVWWMDIYDLRRDK
jgi:K+-dependent Na+/Ca+ exchanger-like protein